MQQLLDFIRAPIILLITMTLLLGIVYPLSCTFIFQLLFPSQTHGSLMYDKAGNVKGSLLIGQEFSAPQYFWGRPSSTIDFPYNAKVSTGNNLGIQTTALRDLVEHRIQALKAADPANEKPVPVDLVTPSASGLDPHISIAAAEYQIPRIAKIRGTDNKVIREMVKECSSRRTFDVLGEKRVNVLQLNLLLDARVGMHARNR